MDRKRNDTRRRMVQMRQEKTNNDINQCPGTHGLFINKIMGSRGFWLSMIWVALAVLPVYYLYACEIYDDYKRKKRTKTRK